MPKTNTTPALRQRLRSQITPFGGWPPDKQCFPVGWQPSPLTFEEIVDALRPAIINDLLFFRKLDQQYIGDLLQQGWLRLWQALHENASLLATMTLRKAADFVSNRCGATVLKDYLKRYKSYHALSRWNDPGTDVYEEHITAIVIGSSLKSTVPGRHALFTRQADLLIDITAALREVADWCQDNLKKLAALYYITTGVGEADAGRIAGLPVRQYEGRKPRCAALQYWVRAVSTRLRETLANYQPLEPDRHSWRRQIKAGDLEPVVQLAIKYANDAQKLLALYALTTQVGLQTIVKELGANESALWYAMKGLRKELRVMYARSALGRA